MLVTRVQFVDLCSRVMKRARAEAPLSKLPWMANRPTNRRGRPIPEGTQQKGHRFGLHVYIEDLHATIGTQHFRQIDLP